MAVTMITKVCSLRRASASHKFSAARYRTHSRAASALAAGNILALAAIVALAIAATSVCAGAQSLPDKKVVKDWVANARKSTDLASYAGRPYHLVAHFQEDFNGKTTAGVYEVLWAAADRFRVEFRVGTAGETDVVLGDKKYVLRNTPTMSYTMWSVSDVAAGRLMIPQSPLDHNDDSVHKVRSEPAGAGQQICADVGDDSVIVHQMCFDPASGAIVAEHVFKRGSSDAAAQSFTLERTDFLQLSDTRIARRVHRHSGPETIDLTVEKWEAVEQSGPDTFVPPAKSVAWDWCASPSIDRHGMGGPAAPELFRPDAPGSGVKVLFFASYHIVGTDGRIEQSTPLFGGLVKPIPGDSIHDRAPIRFCGGKPIRYESISTYWPGLIILGG
jgi:hypothetical protein